MRPTRLILLAVAVLAALTMIAWQVFFVQPEQDCVKQHGVWDAHDHACAKSISISPEFSPSAPVPDSRPSGPGR